MKTSRRYIQVALFVLYFFLLLAIWEWMRGIVTQSMVTWPLAFFPSLSGALFAVLLSIGRDGERGGATGVLLPGVLLFLLSFVVTYMGPRFMPFNYALVAGYTMALAGVSLFLDGLKTNRNR